jgi:hypothetical protein
VSALLTTIVFSAPPAGGDLSILPFEPSDLLLIRWPLIGLAVVGAIWFLLPRSKTTLRQLSMELLLMVPLYLFYLFVRGITEGRTSEAVSRAAGIIKFEQAVGIFWEPRLQAGILDMGFVVNLMNWIYMWGFWPVILLAAIWMFFRHREAYYLYRNAFIISGAIGLLIFALFPVAPPRFMEAWGFVDTIAERSEAYRLLQAPGFVNQYAAMPSLHFGWSLLLGTAIVGQATNLLVRLFGVVLPFAAFAGIVLTGNHYIVDGLAGGSVAMLGLLAAVLLRGLLDRMASREGGALQPLPALAGTIGRLRGERSPPSDSGSS